LRKELDHLVKSERPKAVKAIEEARGHGDLTDNAEYDAAREHQRILETKIRDMQTMLGGCQVVDYPRTPPDRVVFGTLVAVEDLSTGERSSYELVGPYESDTKKGLISVTSPLGKALIGKEEGDQVKVEAPGGIREMEILEIGIGGQGGKKATA
jgi:transcription elongation factor GreA